MCQGVVVRDWRCTQCHKLLGVIYHKRIHLRFSGKHQYIVARPASTICPRCGTLNEIVHEGGPPQK
jgi:phage FluMu protein Com